MMEAETMVATEEAACFPLTHAQKRIWYNEIMHPDLEMANVGYIIRFLRYMDPLKLEFAFNVVLQANPGLRIRLRKVDNGDPYVVQYVSTYQPVRLERLQARQLQAVIKETEEIHNKKFELLNANLIYVAIIHFDDDRTGLYVKIHHIIVDAISAVSIIEQLLEAYQQVENGEIGAWGGKPSYKEYADYEREYLSSDKYGVDENYWLTKFQTIPQATTVAAKPDIVPNMKVKRYVFSFSPLLHKKTQACIVRNSTNIFLLLTAALSVYFSRYRRQKEIVVGRAVHNRQNRHFREMVGMFVTSLPFKVVIDENISFTQMLQNMERELWLDLRHQQYPYDMLVNKLREKKVGFRKIINIQISENPSFVSDGFEIIQQYYALYQDTELFFLVNPRNTSKTQTEIALDYQSELFTEPEIKAFVERLLIILENLLDHQGELLGKIPTVTKNEYQRVVYEFNDTKREYPNTSIPDLFAEMVAKYSGEIAVKSASQQYTYKQLDQISDTVAAKLLKKGVGKYSFVGVMTGRSVNFVIGILAVLKSGAAYLPIDIDYPPERKKLILEDSQTNVVLADRDVVLPEEYTGAILRISDAIISGNNGQHGQVSCGPNDLAYVMYTSGTTGNPKATLITHQNVVRLVKNPDYVTLSAGAKMVMGGAVGFDANTFELWGALLNGGCVYVAEKNEILSPDVFGRILAQEKVNALFLTTALFNKLVDEREDIFDQVDVLLVGGEVLSPQHIGKVFNRKQTVKMINVYGPTENTTFSTWHPIHRVTGELIPIGRPISNSTAYVLDPCLQPLPVGAIGELCVGGDGVAQGYWQRPELTKEKFITDPFAEAGRLYRTGDFVYWLADGSLMFVGRKDNQVKIRGHRIELGEVEAQIMNTGKVKSIAVVDAQDARKNKYLAAFYIPLTDSQAASIRTDLQQVMPDYMVPRVLLPVPDIPLNENGKVNHTELRKILLDQPNELEHDDQTLSDNEKKMLAIFEEVLGHKGVRADDSFFEVGGDSLGVVMILTKIKQGWEVEVPVQLIFAQPTITAIARYVEMQVKKKNRNENTQGKVFNATGHNLFCFHSLLGDCSEYQTLANHIANYSFHSLQVDYTRPLPIKSFAEYIERNRQGYDPVVLIGYSSGGVVAFAVVQELEKRGIMVAAVIMLDSYIINADNKNDVIKEMTDNMFKNRNKENSCQMWIKALKNCLEHLGTIDFSVPISADIINLRAVDKRDEKMFEYANWRICSKKSFYPVEGYGDHIAMLSNEFVSLNAPIISRVLNTYSEPNVISSLDAC